MWAHLKRFVAAMGILACCGAAWGETTIIDDFSDGSAYLHGHDELVDEDTGLTSAIGGVRRVENPWDDGDVVVNSDPYPPYLDQGPYFGQAHVSRGMYIGRMDFSYGNKTAAATDLNLDWRSGGTVTINVAEFRRVDGFVFRYSVTINSGGSDYVYEGRAFDTVQIALSEFAGADLGDIDGLQFRFAFGGPHLANVWLTLDSIETDAIPEPSAFCLLGLAFTALLVYAWRAGRRQE